MNDIIINNDVIKQRGKLISERLDALSENIARLQNELIEIGNHWNDSAHDMFDKKMNDYVSDLYGFLSYMENLDDFIREYESCMDNVDSKYGDTDITIS